VAAASTATTGAPWVSASAAAPKDSWKPYPTRVNVVAQTAVPSRLQGRKARSRIPEAPAKKGATARTMPMNRPARIALGPCCAKKPSTHSKAWRGHAQPRAVGEQEAASQPLAQPEAREVPERGGEAGQREDQREAHLALRGHDASEHDGGLARRDQSDEGAGFEEGEAGDEALGPGAERVREIGERRLVGWLHKPGRDRGERHRGEQPGAEQATRGSRAGGSAVLA
jgi:hypothetical protein